MTYCSSCTAINTAGNENLRLLLRRGKQGSPQKLSISKDCSVNSSAGQLIKKYLSILDSSSDLADIHGRKRKSSGLESTAISHEQSYIDRCGDDEKSMQESLNDHRFSHTIDDEKSQRMLEVTPPVMKKHGYQSPDCAATSVVCDASDYVGEATMQRSHPRQDGEVKGQMSDNIEGQLNSV